MWDEHSVPRMKYYMFCSVMNESKKRAGQNSVGLQASTTRLGPQCKTTRFVFNWQCASFMGNHHTILTIPCNFVPRGWLHILRALLPITFHAVLLAIVAYNNLFISKFTIQIHYCVETVKTYHIRSIFISFKHTTVYIRFLSVIQSQSTQRTNIKLFNRIKRIMSSLCCHLNFKTHYKI